MNGKRMYRPLQKECLSNYIGFQVHHANQRDSFYYAIILPFLPFRNENDLVEDGETVQEALIATLLTTKCVEANEKFRKLLKIGKRHTSCKSSNQKRKMMWKMTIHN
uniref:Uncharacterized protein n=1 Tax=Amphimedon queenslandica TaxID=400682 RepID=A0A1X7VQQ7_AMPQE